MLNMANNDLNLSGHFNLFDKEYVDHLSRLKNLNHMILEEISLLV